MTSEESARAGPSRGRGRPGQRRQLQHPLLPAQPPRPGSRPGRRHRRRPARERSLLPGLAPARDGLELAARARSRWLRSGRSATSARTGSTSSASRPGCASPRSWPTWRRSSAPGSSPPGRSRRSRPSASADTVARQIGTEDTAVILLRFENGARGTVAISQLSAGRKNSLQYEIDGSTARGGVGLGAAGSALDRSSRGRERDPHPQPGAHGRGPGARQPTCPEGTSRASPTPSARCSPPIYADVGAGRPAERPAYPTFADGHDEMLVGDAVAASARDGRWTRVEREAPAPTPMHAAGGLTAG